MNISPNISDIVLLITFSQCVFLTVFILHKYGKSAANRTLALILLVYSIVFLNLFLWEMNVYAFSPFPGLSLSGFAFLIPPLHYLYILFLSRSSSRFKRKHLLHFFPFLIYQSTLLFFFILVEKENVPAPDFSGESGISDFGMIINWSITAQGIIYTIMSVAVIRKYSEKIKNIFSNIENIKLNWLRNITIMFASAIIVFLVENMLVSTSFEISDQFDLSSLISAVYVYVIGYLGLLKSEIFLDPEFTSQIDDFDFRSEMIAEGNVKYSKSGLTAEKAGEVEKKLLKIMEKEKPYTDSSLTLAKLAGMLSVSPHNLSEVINSKLSQNFFDLINGYRVEKVKQDISDSSKNNLTLLAIAFDAGFNSKSAFNVIFKKHCGITPTEYKKSVLKKE